MSEKYHSIKTVWERDPDTKFKTLIEGQWATPEFGYLAAVEWVWTEKIDGTNTRIIWDGATVDIRGRSDDAQMPPHLLKALSYLTPEFMLARFGDQPMTIYGEGYGAKIQKGGGRYMADRCGFIAFDVRVNDWWLRRNDVESVAKQIQVPVVPIVGYGTLRQAIGTCYTGFTSFIAEDKTMIAEGLVMRPQHELRDRRGDRIITKVKCKDFRKVGAA